MRPWLSAIAVAATTPGAILLGCGGGGEGPPLGGPHGGTGSEVSPTDQPARNDAGVINRCLARFSTATFSEGGAAPGGQDAPLWSSIYRNYLSNCNTGAGCHVEMSTANTGYVWLRRQGYINGTNSALVVPGRSCLTCYCGNMPPLGNFNAQAVPDMNAWVTAGASNN